MSESLYDSSASRAVYSCWLCRADHRKAFALAVVATEPWVCSFLRVFGGGVREIVQSMGPDFVNLVLCRTRAARKDLRHERCALTAAGVFSASFLPSCSS